MAKVDKNIKKTKPSARLMEIIHLEHNDISIIMILTVGVGLLSIATPVAVQALVNIVTMGGLLQPLIVISLMLFVFLNLSGFLYVLENYVVELIQRRLFVRMAIDAARKAQSMQVSINDRNNSVELMNRFFEVSAVQKSLASLLTVGLAAALQGFIGNIILMFYSLYFVVVVALIILVIIFIVAVIGRGAVSTAIDESNAKYEVAAWLETIARNLNAFKFSGGQNMAMQRINLLSNNYLDKRIRHFRILLFQNIGGVLLYASAGTAMLALGGFLVLNGQINLGQFVAAELIIFGVLTSFLRFIGQLEYYYDLLAGFDKLGILQDFPQERHGNHEIKLNRSAKLSLNNVSFEYSKRINPLKNVSFTLEAGENLAIVGSSGSGKSTLADLITGLRPPTDGHIELNDVDLRQLNLGDARQQIGLANKYEIIEDTIFENVRLGRSDINIEKVTSVLDQLGLINVIGNFYNGLETTLTSTGAPLSTIQTRLLILARAIIAQPALLIVDGLLDGLDDQALGNACNILFDSKNEWTLIILTRSSDIAKKCNRIISLESAD